MTEERHPTRAQGNDGQAASSGGRRYIAPPVSSNRVVQRPTPRTQAEDPRTFQIQQLKRRFSPVEAADDGGISLSFQLVPSDPDFPFELEV